MLTREVAIHERAVRCQTLEIRKGYIPRRRTNSFFPMGFPSKTMGFPIKTMGFPIKTIGFPIIYRIYRSSDPSTFVETGLTGWQFFNETWGAWWKEWSFSRQQNYWNMSTPQKNKMKPTNPNAHTYVNGTDVETHGYAVTHNTFLQ